MAAVGRPPVRASRVSLYVRITLRSCATLSAVSSYDRVSDRQTLDVRATVDIATFAERPDAGLRSIRTRLALQRAATPRCSNSRGKDLRHVSEGLDYARGEEPVRVLRGWHEAAAVRRGGRGTALVELGLNIMCKVTRLWVNTGRCGASATPQANMVKRCDDCPFEDDDLDSWN